MIQLRRLAASIAVLSALLPAVCGASTDARADAAGSGASFPAPAYAQWATLFGAETGERVTYAASGSGAGVAAVTARSTTFGGTDVPVDADTLNRDALIQFPTLVGGILPVVRIPGVGPGELVLDGRTLADLFMGRIAFWDDPAVLRLNPHLPLPHLAVTPVRRADASGTTATFARYLAAMSNEDQTWLGQTPPALRPIGLTGEGSAGLVAVVAATPGAIGYVGYDYALANHLAYADLLNAAGRVVQPTLASIAAAAAAVDWSHDLAPSLVDRPAPAAWPIVSATYIVMNRVTRDPAAARTARRFLLWAARSGGPAAEDLGFVPVPPEVAARARVLLDDLHDSDGGILGENP